ncbi:NAD(P)/FAD-dependent oxidoreductase [Haliea atlantica]|nr:assimilatory nitrite reductase large subunit [Haliea sp.]|tara:strand:+ start:1270 stop:2475 length:1206 start_codon:yes stop_codon:yes gene_type:complete
MSRRQRLLVVGNGMAATRLLDELLRRDAGRFQVTVVGAEAEPGYNRVLLSPLLAGEAAEAELITHDRDWYRERGIALHCGDSVTWLCTRERRARTASGRELAWDQLVLATGARAARPAVPGIALDNVIALRSLADARWLGQRAEAGGRAIVVGGGLLGLEAACALQARGMQVSVLQRGPWLMNRQLDAEAGSLLAERLARRGVDCQTGARLSELLGADAVSGVCLEDGRRLECDLVVLAAGIEPRTELARAAGLRCDRGVCVDPWLRTSATGVHALGECCQIGEELFGLVAPVYRQAEVLGRTLAGEAVPGYRSEPAPTRLKVSGLEVFSAGQPCCGEAIRSLAWRDPVAGHYRRLWLRAGRLVGAVLLGETRDGQQYFDRIQSAQAVEDSDRLLLGLDAA